MLLPKPLGEPAPLVPALTCIPAAWPGLPSGWERPAGSNRLKERTSRVTRVSTIWGSMSLEWGAGAAAASVQVHGHLLPARCGALLAPAVTAAFYPGSGVRPALPLCGGVISDLSATFRPSELRD